VVFFGNIAFARGEKSADSGILAGFGRKKDVTLSLLGLKWFQLSQ
jgi:hypothetical protein